MFKKLTNLFVYAGLNKEECLKIQDFFARPNWMILNVFCGVLGLVFLGYAVGGFLSPTLLTGRNAFLISSFILFLVFAINYKYAQNNQMLLRNLVVIATFVTYAVGIYNGAIVEANNYSLTFILEIVIIPMIFNAPPIVLLGEMFIADIIFMILVYINKSFDLFIVELADVIALSIVSISLNLIMMNIKAKGNYAQYKANEANKAKTSFLFNMSHDIRTPMNAIIGFRDLLERNQDDPVKRQDYLKKIDDANAMLLSIINNVLEMARIESGSMVVEEQLYTSDQYIDSMFSIFDSLMKQKDIKFVNTVNITHKCIYCDPVKLKEIFANILSNAYKYTNAGGTVTMELLELPANKEGYALYRTTITDTGIGMSEDFLPHIFEEFSREQNTTAAKIEGTGLGMPIVKKLVDMLDGTIEVESKKGVGTKFIVTIPHCLANEEDIVSINNNDYDKSLFKGKRILLAEDNDLNAEIAIEILSEAGFIVDRAEDGQICIDMLNKTENGYYDVILMDIQMPNMNGYEATKAIRSLDNEKSKIKILAMTANAFEEDKRNAFNAGMNGHIAKPIDIANLMSALADALRC
ncbi:MAG: response regulator [Erysipelotrichaceae bacterium]|nr:response regulator [Erysipelotrichaceae bacterium]